MKGKFCWSTQTTTTLITEYRQHELLYSRHHLHYKNRNKRLHAYKCIVTKINEISGECTVSDIKKKINGLRSQYIAERSKVIKSLKNKGNRVYQPTAHWYSMLSFLEQEKFDNKESRQKQNVENPNITENRSSTYKEPTERDQTIKIFGKFIINELRLLNTMGNDSLVREVKNNIQRIIMDAWNSIEPPLHSLAENVVDVDKIICKEECTDLIETSTENTDTEQNKISEYKIEQVDYNAQDSDSDNVEIVYF